jgi:hypothetical protein
LIPLDSPAWANLTDAYGPAAGIPELLRQLRSYPIDDPDKEPWLTLWSALAHQGDVYPASFAAVPHVVEMLAQSLSKVTPSFFQFPAWVEISRQKTSAEVPPELADDYFAALSGLPALVGSAANRDWDDAMLQSALAALAAAQGRGSVAEAILELSPEVASKFLDWFYDQ